MAAATDIQSAQSGLIRQAIRGFAYVLIAILVAIGIAAIALEVVGWYSGSRWKPEDINALLATDSPARLLLLAIWMDIKFLIQYGAYFIAAVGIFLAATQIKTISKLVSDFIQARGAIYQLSATMTNAEASAKMLAAEIDRLNQLKPIMERSAERVEEALTKLGDLERQAVSERVEVSSGPPVAATTTAAIESDESNWERLRELWNANGRRLDRVIEQIPEKRRRNRFSQMSRRNYAGIIEALGAEKLITPAATEASLKLHTTFMSFKPRNRPIPDTAVADVIVLDALLETELSSNPTQTTTPPNDRPTSPRHVENRALEPA